MAFADLHLASATREQVPTVHPVFASVEGRPDAFKKLNPGVTRGPVWVPWLVAPHALSAAHQIAKHVSMWDDLQLAAGSSGVKWLRSIEGASPSVSSLWRRLAAQHPVLMRYCQPHQNIRDWQPGSHKLCDVKVECDGTVYRTAHVRAVSLPPQGSQPPPTR